MKSKYNIDTVSRAVAVLRQILEQGSVPLDAAAAHTAVSKSTAFRLLTTLQNEGLVERASGGGYQLGPELIRWGLLVLGKLDVPSAAAHELRELWLATKETVGLGLVSGASVVLAEILESPSPFRMAEVTGTVVPMHSSALGHAVGAHLPTAVLADQLGPEPYRAITPTSPLRFSEVQHALALAVRDGYALDNEMSSLGVACVAAPIFMRGKVAGAISVAGPRVRMSDERLGEIGRQVAQVASRISSKLSLPLSSDSLPG
jgi:DNA-binding IclR family transcriptional regulator